MLMTASACLKEGCCHVTYSDLYPLVFNQDQMKAKENIVIHTNTEQQSVVNDPGISQTAL